MTKTILTGAACATLLWAGVALGTQSAQEKCDQARVTAWKTYVSCVDAVVAKDAGCVNTGCPASFDEFAAFAKCRHTYFKKWATLQTTSFATSTCAVGLTNRFTDNGTTVTDNLTTLVWEKKTASGVHNGSNTYSWSTGSPYNEDGTAFTTFLTTGLNAPGFAGANGWRLPGLAELQSIVADFACTGAGGGPTCICTSSPCIAFNDPHTQPYAYVYWSATSYVPGPDNAWNVYFLNGQVDNYGILKTSGNFVRAVRGGL